MNPHDLSEIKIFWTKSYFLDPPKYESLGCRYIDEIWPIPTLENKTSILDGGWGGWWNRKYGIEKCAAAADYFGYSVFSLEDRQCFSSSNAFAIYDKHYESTRCSPDGKSSIGLYNDDSLNHNNNVYHIIKGKCIVTKKLQ